MTLRSLLSLWKVAEQADICSLPLSQFLHIGSWFPQAEQYVSQAEQYCLRGGFGQPETTQTLKELLRSAGET